MTTLSPSIQYLNQSSPWLPVKIWDSFKDALVQEANLETNNANLLSVFEYIFSSYAIACVGMSVVLNRIVVFASSRNRVPLPKSTSTTLYFISVTCLVYAIYLIAAAFKATVDTTPFLSRVYQLLCAAQCIEAFVGASNARRPIGDTDITLFELSIMFHQASRDIPDSELLFTCLFAVVSQLVIPVLELSDARDKRLAVSSVPGCAYLWYLMYKAYTGEYYRLPLVIQITSVPKLLALVVIGISFSVYGVAYILRGFSSEGLVYRSFMEHLWTHLNVDPAEEFHSVLIKCALLMCNSVENKNLVNETVSVQSRRATYLDKTYLVSPYGNRVDVVSDQHEETQSVAHSRYRAVCNMLNAVGRMFKRLFSAERKHTIKIADMNMFIGDHNYAYVMGQGGLLPENDTSADYVGQESDSESELESEPEESGDVLFSSHDLVEFARDPVLSSSLQILHHTINNERVTTRSRYAAQHRDEILSDMLNTTAKVTELECVVCKTETRCIILWPCRCFAICEQCRLSLSMRGFDTCVCCRSPVEGFSKVNVV